MSRLEKMAEALKAEIAMILLSKTNDHRIGMVSLTDVQLTKDLSQAKIFVSLFGDEEAQKKSLRGLISAIPFIRGKLSVMNMRKIPKLRFIRDDSLAEGSKKIELINQLAQERARKTKGEKNAGEN